MSTKMHLFIVLFTVGVLGTSMSTRAEEAPPENPLVAFSRAQLAQAGFVRQTAKLGGQELGDQEIVWWEKGSGPTVVMVHGVADQAGTWFQVAPGLAADHRLLLVDLPGHGESPPSSGPLAMTTVLTGFESWLAAQAPKDGEAPILVGNSMGAWIAILTALRHPELVSRVVLVNGGPLRADTGELNLLPQDREEARRLWAALRDPSSPPIPDPLLDDLVKRSKTGHVVRMFEKNEDLESYLMDDGELAKITTPVEILWGESDRYMGREYPDRLLAGLPNARLTLIPQCGHLPQAECPQSFTEILRDVLAQAPPGPAADR